MAIAKRLFETEAKCLAKLGEHDRIPRLFANFEENEEFFLVQELVEGHDLRQEFQAGRKWSEAETVKLLQELLSILSVVHQEGVIHRDLKPANIMRRDRDRKLVLIDFGAVKETLTVDRNGQTNTIVDSSCIIGAPGYMSPEQAMGQPKKCSDVYAVGMLGIQALTGLSALDLPLDSEGLQDIWKNLNVEVSDKLKAILEKMVNFQYRQRYADAAAALEALEVLIPPEPKSFLKKLLLGAIAAVALISGAGVYTNQALNKPDYTQLETYLENKQWKQADLETDKIILGIARESSELDTESIAKFPCKSLEKLDELWTTNSDGKFGFTPQKEIYLATGNEFNSYAEGTYEAFGDRIGWITQMFANSDNFWNVYGNLKLEDENKAPAGHLPSPGLEADGQSIRHKERGKLLSRFNECGI